jgi:hypothetical protein
MKNVVLGLLAISFAMPGFAQEAATPAVPAPAVANVPEVATIVLPADTIIHVTPVEEITSKKMKEGETRSLQVASDVVQDGKVIIPRGSG